MANSFALDHRPLRLPAHPIGMVNYESLVKLIVCVIVRMPEAVIIETDNLDGARHIRVTVDPSDKRQLIGNDGLTAKAIRAILVAVASRHQTRISLEIA